MTTLYVQYCSRRKLACSDAADKDVVLCLQDSALIAPTECTEPSTDTYVGAFADATICQWYSTGDCNGLYVYTFSYDDSILADDTVPLQPADITGVFCKDCMFNYFEYKVGSEVYIRENPDGSQSLISQHGCEYVINSGGGDVVLTPVINLQSVKIAFGAITNAYVAVGFLDVEELAKFVYVVNDTNSDIQLSYDGSTDGPIVEANNFRSLDFAANNGILEAVDIYVKYLGAAPSVGSIAFDGFY